MEFKRENRYLVIKLSDFKLVPKAFRPSTIKRDLMDVGKNMAHWREESGKAPLNCVVVESDWPEYEPTWDAIQRRVEGRPTREEELNAKVQEWQNLACEAQDEKESAEQEVRRLRDAVQRMLDSPALLGEIANEILTRN